MTMAKKILGAALGDGDGDSKLYVDDVFSTYLYTGNGSPQTINNGIDLAGKGGLVWHKARGGASNHTITDTARGSGYQIYPSTNNANTFNSTYALSFKTNGFTENYGYGTAPVVSWTFRRSPKFFDVVTWAGNGVAGRQIPHKLGIAPGMVVVKRTDTTGDWTTYHRTCNSTEAGFLNLTNAFTANGDYFWNSTHPTESVFTLGLHPALNGSGGTYVAYLFAHDPSADGIIQCGSYIGNGYATGPIVNLGWEPQYLMVKNASGTGNWQIIDSMRGMPVGSVDATLQANLTNAESSDDYVSPTATGFQITSASSEVNTNGSNYIYMAIRRPNKPPTTGTQVYNAIARTGTGAAATVTGVGFAPDFVMSCRRDAAYKTIGSRLQGDGALIQTNLENAEFTGNPSPLFGSPTGSIGVGTDTGIMNYSGISYVYHFFRRAPGFFDVVCYTGDGTKSRALKHALGVPVEFGFIKARSTNEFCTRWTVKISTGIHVGRTSDVLNLESNFGHAIWATRFSDPSSTTSVFYVNNEGSNASRNNISGTTYVAYLFASLPGISKVGSYTGNGGSQTIDCGFTTGARFILIKRADTAGDWYVWDTARGIVAANDPHLSLNTDSAEVTTNDSVDPDASGFIVNQNTATNINVSGGQYIFLSVA